MKIKECPSCGDTDLRDCWSGKGRQLQQSCNDCGWQGPLRTPTKQPIPRSKTVYVSQFGGFEYEVFDRYGHTMILSETFRTEAAAVKDLTDEMERSDKYDQTRPENERSGPCTAIIWPASVKVKGKVFKVKKGKVVKA